MVKFPGRDRACLALFSVRYSLFLKEGPLRSSFLSLLLLLGLSTTLFSQSENTGDIVPPDVLNQNPNPEKVPPGILIKGAWASASDSETPLPEGGSIVDNVYRNQYFGLSYPLSSAWYQKSDGPPPSDSGYYVLAQLSPTDKFKGPAKGTILVSAQDLFFASAPAKNTVELVTYASNRLKPDYKVERQPSAVKIANHTFIRFDYVAPVADLHFYVLSTQVRCHAMQFVFTSRDPKLLESLIQEMNKMGLPEAADAAAGTGGGDVPVCIKDYATGKNVVHKVEPTLTDRKFNPIPVRIIISKTGRVKYIHFLSAFPEQAKIISEALEQWTLKPYVVNGEPVEVETGITFGQAPRPSWPATVKTTSAAVSD